MSTKTAISLKRCKMGQGLLRRTNKKSHTRFRLVPKDELKQQNARTHTEKNDAFYGAHLKNLNVNRPTLLAAKKYVDDSCF